MYEIHTTKDASGKSIPGEYVKYENESGNR